MFFKKPEPDLNNVEGEVLAVIEKMVSEENIQLTDLFEDIGDSLDAVEIIMNLEDLFKIDITDEEVQQVTDVQSIIDLVKGKI